jgi:hypothetical protein
MASLTAEFSANRRARPSALPAAIKLILGLKDFQIYDRFISDRPPRVQRVWVGYDDDRDERVLDFLGAAHYMHPKFCAKIVGIAESQGQVKVFYSCPLTIAEAQRALSEAAYRALSPQDRWHVDIVLVPMRDGLLDRTRLDAQSPLHAAPPRFQLGLIEVKS